MEWYKYPRIDNFGVYPDPVGPYPKPDSNFVNVPDGTPITALASGTVTGVRRQPWAPLAWSITIRMDTPYNSVATHTAYNYVEHPRVRVGQHVSFGTELAESGNPYDVGVAFAFCDADVYGQATKNEPFNGTYINPELDPVPFLGSLTGVDTPPSSNSEPGGSLAVLAQTILQEIGVPQQALDVLTATNSQALTWIGAAIVTIGLAAAAGVLFLFTEV